MKKIIIRGSFFLSLISYTMIECGNVEQDVKLAIANNNFNGVYHFVEKNNFTADQLKNFLDLSIKCPKLNRNFTKGIVQLLLGLGVYTLSPKLIMQCAGHYSKTNQELCGVTNLQIDGVWSQIEALPNIGTIPPSYIVKAKQIVPIVGAIKPIWFPAFVLPYLISWYIFWKAFNNLHGRNGEVAKAFKIIRYLQHKIEESTKAAK